MKKQRIIYIYTGENIEKHNIRQLHPINEVRKAIKILNDNKSKNIYYSNSTDFSAAMYYIGKKMKIKVKFYLNGKPASLEKCFKSWNKSFTLMDKGTLLMIHTINFKSQFADKILSGEKKQTIRLPRKKEIKIGDELHLYTGQRTKKCKLLKKDICKSVIGIKIDTSNNSVWLNDSWMPLIEVNKIANADGFKNSDEFFDFFNKNYKEILFEGFLIKW